MFSRGRGVENGLGGWGGEILVNVENGETSRLKGGGVNRRRRTSIFVLRGFETRCFRGLIHRRGRGRLITVSGVKTFLAAGENEVLQ